MTDQLGILYGIWTNPSYVRIEDNTMYLIKNHITDEGKTEIEVPFINFNTESWDIYNYYSDGGYLFDSLQTTWTGKYLGCETVTVPAGTFEDCPVFEITMTDNITRDSEEDISSEITVNTLKVWCAANVGWIKSITVFASSVDDGEMHTDFTYVAELTFYSIPED